MERGFKVQVILHCLFYRTALVKRNISTNYSLVEVYLWEVPKMICTSLSNKLLINQHGGGGKSMLNVKLIDQKFI